MTVGRVGRRPRAHALLIAGALAVILGIGTLPAAAASTSSPAAPTSTPAPTTRIVGGTTIGKGDLPSLAAIVIDEPGPATRGSLACSGTVIAEQWVLTAGHCSEVAFFGVPIAVQVGSRDLGGEGAVKVPVDRLVVNRTWFKSGTGSDISLMHLATPVTVPISTIASSSDAALTAGGVNVTIAGWGLTKQLGLGEEPKGRPPKRARSLSLPLIDDATCSTVFADVSPTYFVPASDLCAGSEGKSPCFGDSGGPMFAKNADGALVQIGVTSRGVGCATKLFPGIFTDVFALRDWIAKYTTKRCRHKITIIDPTDPTDPQDPDQPPFVETPTFVC